MRNKLLLASLVFICACGRVGQYSDINLPNNKLVIVSTSQFQPYIDQLVYLKQSMGFDVSYVDVKQISYGNISTWGENLRKLLFSYNPSYVFLIGDMSIIPTIYKCSDINWSSDVKISCLYSDTYMGVDAQNNVKFVVGRLPIEDKYQLKTYLYKEQIYVPPTQQNGYVLADDVYDPQHYYENYFIPSIENDYVNIKMEAIRPNKTEFFPTGSIEHIEQEVNNGDAFINYYGHGTPTSWGWGVDSNKFQFTNSNPIPLVLAIACETALSAPNVPWYNYFDANEHFHWVDYMPRPITESNLDGIASVQQNPAVIHNIGDTFVVDTFASMVYIGETVVTSTDWLLLQSFFTNLFNAYNGGDNKTIGNIWYQTIAGNLDDESEVKIYPSFYQIIGDPTISVIGN